MFFGSSPLTSSKKPSRFEGIAKGFFAGERGVEKEEKFKKRRKQNYQTGVENGTEPFWD